MKLGRLLLLLCLWHTGWVQADIYKYVDRDGHVTYSSVPIKGAKKMNLEPLPMMASPKHGGGDDLRVNQELQKKRDEARRRILQDELATEQKQLAESRQKLKDTQENPRAYRGPDGKTYRNVPGYEEAVQSAQSEVTLHEKNIEALQAELSRLK